MGKPTGFMEIARQTSTELPPEERIQNFNEFHIPLPQDEQQAQGARCMDCGVPFCQSWHDDWRHGKRLPAEQPDPRMERPGLSGQVGSGCASPARHQPLPGVYQPGLPRPVRSCLHLRQRHGDPVTVKENERAIVEYGYESGAIPPARPRPAPARPWRSSAQGLRAFRWPTF